MLKFKFHVINKSYKQHGILLVLVWAWKKYIFHGTAQYYLFLLQRSSQESIFFSEYLTMLVLQGTVGQLLSKFMSKWIVSCWLTWLRGDEEHGVGAEASQAWYDAPVHVHIGLHHASVGLLVTPRVRSHYHHLGACRGWEVCQSRK